MNTDTLNPTTQYVTTDDQSFVTEISRAFSNWSHNKITARDVVRAQISLLADLGNFANVDIRRKIYCATSVAISEIPSAMVITAYDYDDRNALPYNEMVWTPEQFKQAQQLKLLGYQVIDPFAAWHIRNEVWFSISQSFSSDEKPILVTECNFFFDTMFDYAQRPIVVRRQHGELAE